MPASRRFMMIKFLFFFNVIPKKKKKRKTLKKGESFGLSKRSPVIYEGRPHRSLKSAYLILCQYYDAKNAVLIEGKCFGTSPGYSY